MSHSLPSTSLITNGSGSVPPFSTPSDSKSTSSGSMRAGSESSPKGSSSSTPSEPLPAATLPTDEVSSSALIALISLGLPNIHRLYEALGPRKEEAHEKKMRQREIAHAQEREQVLQTRIVHDEPYFHVENDRGGWDVLTREEFNDLRDRRKARGHVVSIREPVYGELVGGNGFKEEDHVRIGQTGMGSIAVVLDQENAIPSNPTTSK